MNTRLAFIVFVGLLFVACAESFHATDKELASDPVWDLSYRSVLETNQVSSNDWLAIWIKKFKSPSGSDLLDLVKGAESAILLEYPALHAAERLTFVFSRTTRAAFCWNFVNGEPHQFVAKPLDPVAFDFLVKQLLTWQQGPPQAGEPSPGFLPGYFAILSVRDRTVSKQLLLTLYDFKIPTDPQWTDAKPGKVYKAFDPVIRLYD